MKLCAFFQIVQFHSHSFKCLRLLSARWCGVLLAGVASVVLLAGVASGVLLAGIASGILLAGVASGVLLAGVAYYSRTLWYNSRTTVVLPW